MEWGNTCHYSMQNGAWHTWGGGDNQASKRARGQEKHRTKPDAEWEARRVWWLWRKGSKQGSDVVRSRFSHDGQSQCVTEKGTRWMMSRLFCLGARPHGEGHVLGLGLYAFFRNQWRSWVSGQFINWRKSGVEEEIFKKEQLLSSILCI